MRTLISISCYFVLGIYAYVNSFQGPAAGFASPAVVVLKETVTTTRRDSTFQPMPDSSSSAAAASAAALLPSTNQTWVHAVDSRADLRHAMAPGSKITAIETDVIMGHTTASFTRTASGTKRIPIMAHPPITISDLSMTDFLDNIVENEETKTVNKVIKLDFKELEPVEATLQAIVNKQLQTSSEGAFVLNADILPGPGHDEKSVSIPAELFLETCLRYIRQSQDQHHQQTNNGRNQAPRFAFSLGFRAHCSDPHGYTASHVQSMSDLITRYQLQSTKDDPASDNNNHNNGNIGVILALNARQLAKSLDQFDGIMDLFPDLQILAWVGKGEPGIQRESIQSIETHFRKLGMSNRIGFDCRVAENYWSGITADFLVDIYGYISRTGLL